STEPQSIFVNFFYLLFYPLFFLGIINLPFAGMNKMQRVNLFLEITVIVLSLGIGLWYLLVEPFLNLSKVSASISIMLVAAPVCDAALLWFVLKLLFKKKSPLLDKSYRFLAYGLFILTLSDMGFLYMALVRKEFWSLFAFLGYPTSQVFIVLSAIEFFLTSFQVQGIKDEPMRKESYALAPVIIAYSSFSAVFVLLLLKQKEKPHSSFLLFIFIVILLGLLRQIISIVENKKLFSEIQSSHKNLEKQVEIKTGELSHSYDETLNILSKALELRDRETQGHTVRLAELTVKLAKICGIENGELISIKRGALLHDIGKMGIPDNILLKPGPLDEEEWKIMKKHPIFAKELLERVSFLKKAVVIPYFHHERWDGSGYPEGLKGKEIPIEARIFAVLDCWDALTHDRPYRSAWSHHLALEYIISSSGVRYDPEIVKKFVTFLKENPSYFEY
ncbi:MAG: HD domain-containing phosphohydrolase, partial [Thermoanaerobaculia bacterium]